MRQEQHRGALVVPRVRHGRVGVVIARELERHVGVVVGIGRGGEVGVRLVRLRGGDVGDEWWWRVKRGYGDGARLALACLERAGVEIAALDRVGLRLRLRVWRCICF